MDFSKRVSELWDDAGDWVNEVWDSVSANVNIMNQVLKKSEQYVTPPSMDEIELDARYLHDKAKKEFARMANPMYATLSRRLGSDPANYKNLEKFAELTAEVESGKDPTAKNTRTSATGAFQYVKGSVVPAINRMERYGDLPKWAEDMRKKYKDGVSINEHRDMMSSLTYDQQKQMFLADITEKRIEKPGYGDQLLNRILNDGDVEAMKELYYKGHHTAPDEPTVQRVDKIFGSI